MAGITYIKGDATTPQGDGPKIICHICNDIGGWGRGFVMAISRRWKQPESEYRAWHSSGIKAGFALGHVQFVPVESDIWVANMIAQRGVKPTTAGPPIRYAAVAECLQKVAAKAQEIGASLHMPRIGCGLAGGDWANIEPLIEEHVCALGIPVVVYDFAPDL